MPAGPRFQYVLLCGQLLQVTGHFKNIALNDQKWLLTLKSQIKVSHRYPTSTLWVLKFNPFCYGQPFLSYGPFWHKWNPKWHWILWGHVSFCYPWVQIKFQYVFLCSQPFSSDRTPRSHLQRNTYRGVPSRPMKSYPSKYQKVKKIKTHPKTKSEENLYIYTKISTECTLYVHRAYICVKIYITQTDGYRWCHR